MRTQVDTRNDTVCDFQHMATQHDTKALQLVLTMQATVEPVTKEAVLGWLEGVTTASMQDIANGLKASAQMHNLSQILQELQNVFEIATKAGKFFTL